MPDHTITPPSDKPDAMLDQWLDALNEQDGIAPPPPAEIAELAAVAREYRQVLGMMPAAQTAGNTGAERNGSMHGRVPKTGRHPRGHRS